MNPLASSSSLARTLASFWNESRLSADQAKSATIRPAPEIVSWRDALEDILKVGYAMQTQSRVVEGARQRVSWRTVPSAGGLYPFEVIACVFGEATYLWDVERALLVPLDREPLSRADLAAAGIVTEPGRRLEALLVLVARPWLSMNKYRQRGYIYCHLDVGHVTTNLAIYTTALGYAPTVHLRFHRGALVERLRIEGLCREPLAVLSFARAEEASPAAAGPEAAPGLAVRGFERPELPERLAWESLQGILSFDGEIEPPATPASAPLLAEPAAIEKGLSLPFPQASPERWAAAQWRSAILCRRSAKGFRGEPLSVAQLGELLAALRAEGVPADCPSYDAVRVGVRLVAANVDGLSGVFAYSPGSHALHPLDAMVEDPRSACMLQEIARGMAALVILHAPIFRLFDRQGYSAFAELHFRAAEVGQRLHLAAARLGVGITCLGGFDGQRCAALAHLGDDEEVVYVLLLGVADEAAVKQDRLSVAFSHGYST